MKKSKKDRILDYLRGGYSITPLEAWKIFGLYRLADVVYRLKKEGWDIKTEDVTESGATFARYKLVTQVDTKGQMSLV